MSQAPFLPVFLSGLASYILSMFLGSKIADKGHPWVAGIVVFLGSFSFVFGFPWAALF